MKHGLAMEPHAKRKLVEVYKLSHKNVKCDEVGLCVSPDYPHLGASPDLLLSCSCCGKFVVEIKCPESIKMTSPSVHNISYLECDNDITKLKERHAYYFQVQGQMGITKINQAIFFVYTHHGYFMQKIDFDLELWEQMVIKFNYFWSKYIAQEILGGNSDKASCSKGLSSMPVVSLLNANKNKNAVNTENVCVICLKEMAHQPKSPADYSIFCESCKQWCHILCAGVTEDQCNDEHFNWRCQLCTPVDFIIN